MNTRNTKSPGSLRLFSLGDIHLGHPQTPTELIINNLDRYCTNEKNLREIDLLVLTGDIFDRLLTNAEDNVVLIQRWITHLLYKCSKHDVMLRIVEGTPSHDREQSRFFVEQARNANIDIDIHYATTLSIEYIERWDINVLYVPDKWRPHTSDTLAEVKELMASKGLEQVDFAIMHGAFEYQLPSVVTEPTHCSKTYLGLVKYLILIGHVHLQSQLERILAAGSYDRTTHGEEGPKGFYDVSVKSNGDTKITFRENLGAKRYDTINCHGMDVKELNVLLRKHVSDLPKGSAVRLRCYRGDPASGDIESIQSTYPHIIWTLTIDKLDEKVKKSVGASILDDIDLSEFVDVRPDNIKDLLLIELERVAKDSHTVARCLAHLDEVI